MLTVTHMPFSRHRRRYLVDSVSRHHDGTVIIDFSSLIMVEEFLALWLSVLLHLCGFLSCLVQRVSAAIDMLLILTAHLVGDVW